MSDITWPTAGGRAFYPEAFDEGLEFDVELNVARNGRISTRALPGARWRCTMAFPADTVAWLAERRQLEAFLATLRGGANRLLLWNLLTPEPEGTLRGTVTVTSTVSAGVRAISLTGGRAESNFVVYPQTFTLSPWTGSAAATGDTDTAPDGTTTADSITDDNAVATETRYQSMAVPDDGSVYCASVYVLKTSGGTAPTFVMALHFSGGTTTGSYPRLNTDTGQAMQYSATVEDVGDFWRISTSLANNSSGNTTMSITLYPAFAAYGSSAQDVTQTGSAVVWGAMINEGATALDYPGLPTLLRGDRFSVGGQRVMVTADAQQVGAGTMAVSFEPALRAGVSAAAAVTITRPTTTYVLTQPTVMMPARGDQLPGFAVELVEA